MRTRSVSTLACAALLACALPLRAQEQPPAPPSDPNKTYTLVAKFSANDLLRYKFGMNTNIEITAESGNSPIPNMEMAMNAILRMKTVGVKPDGSAVIATQMQNGEMTMMGNTTPFPEMPAVEIEVDRRGIAKIRKMPEMPGGQMFSQMMNFNQMPSMGVALPDHPVKVGDTWEADIPFPMSEEKAKAVCTLLGVEPVGGQETLRIKQVMTVPFLMRLGKDGQPTKDPEGAMMTMSGKFTINTLSNMLPENARVLKTAGDIDGGLKMEMQGDAAQQSPFGRTMTMKMNGKMTMDLISAGKAPAAPARPKPAPPKPVRKK